MEVDQAADQASDPAITKEMIEEEQRLAAENEIQQEEENQVEDDFDKLEQQQRFARLKHLLKKSSLYSEFLRTKMETQKEEEKARLIKASSNAKAKKAKKTQKSDRKTRNGADSVEATPTQKPRRTTTKRKLDNGPDSYNLADNIAAADAVEDISESEKVDNSHETKVLSNGLEVPVQQPELLSGGVLKNYQVEGLEWLKALYLNGLNGILADEMGLGKTIQTISFIAHLCSMKVKGPYLIVAPMSTLSNWEREFKRFTPKLPVVLYHGTPDDRKKLRGGIMKLDKKTQSFKVVITSYAIIMNDRKFLQHYAWKYIVVDEGHRLKNLNCRLIKELKSYKSANRLLLTGTPLQNNLSELWSLLNFLMPDIFDDLDSFQRWFDFSKVGSEKSGKIVAQEEEEQVLSKLHTILKPFLLRRLKSDVDFDIPAKKEMILYCPLVKFQEPLYKSILNRTLYERLHGDKSADDQVITGKRRCTETTRKYATSDADFFDVAADNAKIKASLPAAKVRNHIPGDSLINYTMRNSLMQLRKCCNHPYLIEYPTFPGGNLRIDDSIFKVSGKMLMLNRLLPALFQEGHKVLIFSQMTSMLDILGDYCDLMHYKFSRLDGTMAQELRDTEIDTFNNEEDVKLFLLSTRAGGLGLNLVSADTVIIYDSDWNPQVDLQAQDRCHRIGQTKTVMVYRLITANTVDQRILERAERKRKLEKLVIHKSKFKGQTQADKTLQPEELLELLDSKDAETIDVNVDNVLPEEELQKVLRRQIDQDHPDLEGKTFKVIEEIPREGLL